jgi:hypothetical protein
MRYQTAPRPGVMQAWMIAPARRASPRSARGEHQIAPSSRSEYNREHYLANPPAVCGPGARTEASPRPRAHDLSHRVLPKSSVRRLWRDRPGRSRGRPLGGQVFQPRASAPLAALEGGPRRDRQVRGRVRKLPSPSDGTTERLAASHSHRSCDGGERVKRAAGVEPVSESLEGSCATVTPRPQVLSGS